MTAPENPNVAADEHAKLIDQEAEARTDPASALLAVGERLLGLLGAEDARLEVFRDELTVVVPAARILDALQLCRDDEGLRCELLVDLSGVHWPGGREEQRAQETTGWPVYVRERTGTIAVCYIVRSIVHNHLFRLRVDLPDVDPHLPSATSLYGSAGVMEREVYDFFGVVFDGHPNLTRILMPDEWEGHPHRKDYPLGGVEVQYHGATIPPPDQRSY